MPSLTADDARRAAAAEGDPELLIGQDVIRYAEALMREDHRILAPHFQFWGGVADYLNHVATLPDRPGAQNHGTCSEFNRAIATAVGYIKMSSASRKTRLELLRKHFPPSLPGLQMTEAEWKNGGTGS